MQEIRRSIALAGAVVVCLAGGGGCRAKETARADRAAAAPKRPASPAPRPIGLIDESSEPASDGGILRRRLDAEPTTLNAVLQSSTPEGTVLAYVQRNLLDFDSSLRLIPGLAERWEGSPDGLEYTLAIRSDAVWEDGRPVTARDAAFTIGKIVDPKIPANFFKPLFDDFVSVKVLGEREFRVRFSKPYVFRAMAFVLPVLPEHRFAGQNFLRAPDNRAPLSSGPYRVVSWKTQQEIVLERNPRAFGPRGHFDKVLFRILPDSTTAYRLLTSGELDQDQLNPQQADRALRDDAFGSCCRLVEFYNLDYIYIGLNTRSPFFEDARVRRAATMLLDRAAIVRSLMRGSARIISGPWSPDSPAYDPALTALPFDPPAAARLLDEAGWRATGHDGKREKDGKPFEFDLLVSEGSEVGRQIDEMLASELAKVGVTAHVRAVEWGAFVERVDAGDFVAASGAWSASDPNPDPYFYWHSSQCAPHGLNDGCYRSAEADALMEQAQREPDEGKRNALYHRLHRIFRDDAPAIFVANSTQKYGFSKRVRGLTTSPLSFFFSPGALGWWLQPAPSATSAMNRPSP